MVLFQFYKMRGGAQLITCLQLVTILQSVCAFRCDREPEGHMPPKSEADYRFKIQISGNPDKYVPGEVYTGNIFVQFFKYAVEHNLVLIATVRMFPCDLCPAHKEREGVACGGKVKQLKCR
jgi:hypothetical protein